jgi:hypothetical protein
MAFERGPYIQAACFCELVIADQENVLSLIRVVDTLNHFEAGPNPPEDMPPFMHPLKLVLMLKSGEARGRSNLRIVPQVPTGETKDALDLTVHFEGDEKGHNIAANLNFGFEMEGLYWFHVYVDDHKLTSIPLRVKYDRRVMRASG